jgi:predicted permease
MQERSGRRWSRIFKPEARTEVNEELAFHLEQRVQDNIARGMDPESARAAALERLGDLKSIGSECADLLTAERRAEKRRDWARVSLLDFKLGLRMLVKYPGLTLVGGFAMAFAIWVGAGTFEALTQIVDPKLPLPDGDRIVAVRNWDAKESRVESHALHDFVGWREEVRTIENLGAYRTVQRNISVGPSLPEPVDVAEISASAFRVARVRPVIGRTLLESDEQPGAPAVAVIGYDEWQRRFAGSSDLIGRTLKVGTAQSTVVGVMPEGFAFPVAHSVWIPLRLNVLDYARRTGPGIAVFGMLRRGVALADAQAELTQIGERAAAGFPETHEHLRPQVLPYAKSILNLSGRQSLLVMSSNLFLVMLLALICANVALLMFARAATRESEITVRSALGATRGRIVGQLFAEALVLGAVATALGLGAAGFGLRWAMRTIVAELANGLGLPFWFHASLSPATIAYAVLLTVIGAAIAGVMPALKVTRGLQSRLRAATTGGGLSFGGVWTAVIVAQVALTVAFPFTGFMVRRDSMEVRHQDTGIPDREYLTARLELDRTTPGSTAELSDSSFSARYQTVYQELARRVAAEPAVASITFGSFLPRMYHPHRLIDVDAGGAAPLHPDWPAYRVSSVRVDFGFFEALNVPILAGRAFRQSDVGSGHPVIIVNRSFVQRVLGGRNAIGRRVRYTHFEGWTDRHPDIDQTWYEIVGVVKDLGMSVGDYDPKVAGFYHPVDPAMAYPLNLGIHVKGDPSAFAPRLRAIATTVDPGLRLYDPMPLDQVTQSDLRFYSFWLRIIALVSVIALLLSLAGIYAVMSFTVSRRTREIGIRIALGSSPLPIVASTLKRPVLQVALGILAGAGIVGVLMFGVTGGSISFLQSVMIAGYTLLMLGVCLLACVLPTRRALRVQPIEALRAEA